MFDSISVKDLDTLAYDPDVLIIDLRDESDYHKKHIKNAINIEYEKLFDSLYNLNKRKTIVLYCERGSKSIIAAKKLSEMGYTIKTVTGGYNMYKNYLKHNF